MLEKKSIDHFRVSGVHVQNHLVFDKAGDVGMQKKAGLDHFFGRFIIYTQRRCIQANGKEMGCVPAGSLRPVHASTLGT